MPLLRIRLAIARLRALGGVHGEFTYHNAAGFHTLAFERGTITSVSGSALVVRAPDGTVWTWQIVATPWSGRTAQDHDQRAGRR